jgi:L-histidine N-alpha-methyltransferase
MNDAHFEDAAHRISLTEHLRRRRTPVKFAYAGSATGTHIALADNLPFEELGGRAEHEVRAVLLVGKPLPSQICDVGPSNGLHTIEFLRRYRAAGGRCTRYLAMDYSGRLLAVARENLASCVPDMAAFVRWDMEMAPSTAVADWRGQGPVLMCLLGNTLGNVEQPDRSLVHLRASCRTDDLLLLSVSLLAAGDEATLLHPYHSAVFRNMVLQPLRAAGIPDRDVDLVVRLENDTIVAEARLSRSARALGVDLLAGETIGCFRSRRHHKQAVIDLLRATGWQPLADATSADGSQLSVAARRAAG